MLVDKEKHAYTYRNIFIRLIMIQNKRPCHKRGNIFIIKYYVFLVSKYYK